MAVEASVSPKSRQQIPDYLTPEECEGLLAATGDQYYTSLAARDRAALTLLVYTGLRRQELIDLTLDDIDLAEGTLRVERGKGNKSRMVPLAPEATSAVAIWLRDRPTADHRALMQYLALRHAHLAVQFRDRCARFRLLQGEHYLRLRVALPLHRHQSSWIHYTPSFTLIPGGPRFGVQTT